MSRNKETLGPPPQLPTQPINYGVELEFVFAFRQSELELGYTNGVPNTLKKNLKYFEREVHPKFTQIDPVTLPVSFLLFYGSRRARSCFKGLYESFQDCYS